jgi:hypothetical protein
MSNHQGPRAGSRAYIVLEHLFRRAHASAHKSEVRRAAAPNLSPGEFDCIVVTSLARFGFIVETDGALKITAAGKRYMEPPVVETGPAPEVVASRYVAPMTELKNRFKNGPAVIRAGAFDYRDVPSLHGAQRLQHKSVIPGLGAAKE